MLVGVELLAVEAVEAFVHIDFAARRDRLDRTLAGAELARTAAFGAPLQRFEGAPAQQPANRHGGTERTDEAAKEALDEQTGD